MAASVSRRHKSTPGLREALSLPGTESCEDIRKSSAGPKDFRNRKRDARFDNLAMGNFFQGGIVEIRAAVSQSNHGAMPPVVFVIDDDVSARESLQSLIRSAGWQPRAFASAHEFLIHPRLAVPSCLVLDVSLSDINGLDLQKRIAFDRIHVSLIFVTGYRDVPTAVQAMKHGAVDFLTKPINDAELLTAMGHALDRSRTVLLQEAEIRVLGERYASLTCREREVMALVVAGRLNKLVGAELGISEVTVKAHRGSMMRKMGACSVTDLVKIAAKLHPGCLERRPITCRPTPSSQGYLLPLPA